MFLLGSVASWDIGGDASCCVGGVVSYVVNVVVSCELWGCFLNIFTAVLLHFVDKLCIFSLFFTGEEA